ncbi:MAG: methyltransferase domain-containing protein [Candidatus Doudnabacteria bacterium]|nr:methyltransferase domain-containing protein [Candidatus Doudnabacteria bacterium]
MEDYRAKAVNPQQYDSPELDWRIDGDEDAYWRIFFRNHLKPYLNNLAGKRVLDIGSGVGQLFNMLKGLGASEIVGIDPSKRNVESSQKTHPDVVVLQKSLQQFDMDIKFDVAICIMVFEHIPDIDVALSRVSQLLNEKGRFYLIVGDMECFIQSIPGAEVDAQPLPEGGYATKTIRPNGTMFDIFRPLENYITSAQFNGLKLVDEKGLVSTSEQHKSMDGKPICHLLVLEK